MSDENYCPECGGTQIREPEEKGHFQCGDRACLQEFFSDVKYDYAATLRSKTNKIKSLEAENAEMGKKLEEAEFKINSNAAIGLGFEEKLEEANEKYSSMVDTGMTNVEKLNEKLALAVDTITDLLDKQDRMFIQLRKAKRHLVNIHNNDDPSLTVNNVRAEALVIASSIGLELDSVNFWNIKPSIDKARAALKQIKGEV